MKTTRLTRAMEVGSLILLTVFATQAWGVDTTAHTVLYSLGAALTAIWIVIDTAS